MAGGQEEEHVGVDVDGAQALAALGEAVERKWEKGVVAGVWAAAAVHSDH